jgi:hypothetical protein
VEDSGWGASRIVWELERAGAEPVPGQPGVCSWLVRHGLMQVRTLNCPHNDILDCPNLIQALTV